YRSASLCVCISPKDRESQPGAKRHQVHPSWSAGRSRAADAPQSFREPHLQPSAPRLPGKEPPCRTSPLKAESRQTGFPCLQELLNLRFLMLGQNQIGTLRPEMFSGMRNLSDLDLPLNALTLLPSDAFKPLIALKVLDLSLNRIQKISPKKLDLHDNPWHCDCQLASLVQWMGRTAATLSPRDAVKCVSPPQLRRRSLGGLQEDKEKKKRTPAVPPPGAPNILLSCLVGPESRQTGFPCLQELLNLRFLMLGQNQIGTLRPEMFSGMRNLSDLDLPLNALTLLPSDAFKPLIALKVLDLSGNRLKTLDGTVLVKMPGLKKLDLHDNPWHCDCQLASLVQWMGRTAATLSPRDAVKCVSPPQLRRRSLGGLQEDCQKLGFQLHEETLEEES
uniref:LRRCT domain-containing protein n=1 Tax=Salarias fasciatus TaxID=181472 RepID=A0A672FT19_SALFA